jgi:hypothetical protein
VLVFRSPLPPCTYAADAPAGSCYAKNEWVLTEASLGATVGPVVAPLGRPASTCEVRQRS